ncbi:MAG: asparagine synthase (glutamine-hydrolyzing) [Ruminococcaceae bacterium]|nr:asparagine synthase (glutamine-hydrolyzing) [Oscillospiraceae bacterium]
MCSICGMIEFEQKNGLNPDVLNRMGMTMKHRGPDQTNAFYSEFAMLHHNRLSVIDPENGLQPMTAEWQGEKYTIVYNGELYNTPELRDELSRLGVIFKTHCDTEVVLYAYILFGERCPEKMNGIFAFGVYDEGKKQLFLARDRIGVKPLFYTKAGSTFLFASEIKALLAHPDVQPKIDRVGLWQLLYLTPVTIGGSGVFQNIYEVKPGYCGVFSEQGLRLRPYWTLEARECHDTPQQAAMKTRELLTDAISRQLVSDVPLCTFLSGGLDSSVITSVAAGEYRRYGETLSTYSFEYEGNKENFQSSLFQPQGDDEFALFLAEWLGTSHTVLTAPTLSVAKKLFDATLARDIPGQADIDSSLLYFCSQVKEGHTVALSGECADEIFGGYPWFYRPGMLYRDFFPWIHNPKARIQLFDDGVVKAEDGYDYMSTVYQQSIRECQTLDTDSFEDQTARVATWLSVSYFMTSLLERKDRMSMANGLEVRVPFSDHRILEYVYNVPWKIKFENQTEKALLRNAMAEFLPDKILYRKKSPYPKTHNPLYQKVVTELLQKRLEQKGGVLHQLLDTKKLQEMLESENTTWFGQLMATPQLIAWLIQFDFWFEQYQVQMV